MLDDHECLSSETQDDRSEEAVQKNCNLKEKVEGETASKCVENNAPGEVKKIETSNVKHFLVNRIQPIKSKVETSNVEAKSLAQIEMESEVMSIQNQLLSQ